MNLKTKRYKIRLLDVIYAIALILADLFIFMVLGLFFMGYDDFYDESKGPYMSLQSMKTSEKIIYFAINLWYIANTVLIIWAGFKIYKWFKSGGVTRNDA